MDMQALPTSWKRVPFNEGIVFPYQSTFDDEQFSRLKEGHIPQGMDDKWFIYYEEPYLFLHRSWTGRPVYRIALKCLQNGAEVTEALWSKDLANDSKLDIQYQVRLIDFLVSNLLLRQNKPFPVPSELPESKHAAFQHNISGTGYPTSAPEPKNE